MAEQYTTLGQSTLSSPYTAGSGSMTLASAASFPTAATFSVRLNGAAVYTISAVAGAVFTATLEHGTDVDVAAGANVVEVLTQRVLDQIRADEVRSGTRANLPAAGARKEGDLYLTTDSQTLHRCNGSNWEQSIGGIYIKKEPTAALLSSFTWVNQDNATAVYSNGKIIVKDGGLGAAEWHYAWIATPAAPWTLDVVLSGFFSLYTADFPSAGIGVGGGTTWSSWGAAHTLTGMQAQNMTGTAAGSYTGQLSPTIGVPSVCFGRVRLKIQDDNTNRIYSVLPDLENVAFSYTEGRTTRFTADRVMFFTRSTGVTTNNIGFTIESWDLTSP